MSQPDTDRNPVEVLAEEFATRVRNGETPSVQQYADQYPELADEINELFPSIAMMEAFGSREHAERNAEKSQAVFAATPIEQLGDFRIVRQIGRGGMGVVYEAEQESLGRHVAVKVLGSNAVSSPRQLQRFHREAHAAASLHHTNIVPIFGVGQHDEVHYYVMQLIDGVGLDQIIQELSQNAPAGQSAAHSEGGSSSDSAGSARAAAEALCNGDLVAASRATALSNAWSPTSPSNESKSPPESKLEAAAETIVREIPRLSGDATSDANTVCPAADGETVVVQRSETEANRSEDKSRRRELGDRYWKSVAKMGVQLADALEYAHTQNVLHRDIKPSNLLLDRQGTVWITDFGLAKHTESHDLTNTGDIVGTLRYMAPEQFNGRYNAQSDLYNLGVTLYELITLQPAFGESQQGILIQKITSSESPSPRSINPAIPRDLETIVLKATANEPSRRYASAGELADDLQRFLDDMPIRARRVTLPERIWRWSRRNPALAMASGSALMLLVLVAVVALWGNIRTNQALERVSKERDNVRMAKEEAERASNSAEENLAFAIETFRNIVSNIASRGAPASLDIELEEGETPPHEMALTEGDAQLLTNLVEFFEEFARNNQSDLREETAEAYRSVGEIRRRLGQFDDSVAAYNKALQIYQQLAESGPTVPNVIMQAKTLNEIGLAHRDQGDFLQAMRSHEKATNVLRRQPDEIADDRRCRFELVRTYLAQASFWEPSGIISQDASTASDTDRQPPSNREDEHPPDNRGDEQRERSPDDDRELRVDRLGKRLRLGNVRLRRLAPDEIRIRRV